MDRFSDITLFIGLIYLYAKAGSVTTTSSSPPWR